jgi:hypothetical protein
MNISPHLFYLGGITVDLLTLPTIVSGEPPDLYFAAIILTRCYIAAVVSPTSFDGTIHLGVLGNDVLREASADPTLYIKHQCIVAVVFFAIMPSKVRIQDVLQFVTDTATTVQNISAAGKVPFLGGAAALTLSIVEIIKVSGAPTIDQHCSPISPDSEIQPG